MYNRGSARDTLPRSPHSHPWYSIVKTVPSTVLVLAILAAIRFDPNFALGQAASADIPRLPWQERSDWINVRKHVDPPAVGDGHADDTAAIQAALDRKGDGRTVYLPPGTYRITKTLVFRGPRHGCLVVGHGRDTRIVWDGPEGGRMFWSDGVAYSRYVGLSWDGRGKAAVGFDHAAQHRFETEVLHQYEAFRNFTGSGIRVGHEQKVASAEILYHNCLFENCGTGLAFLDFNDYDNSIDHCEFRHCGKGVLDNKGNFYARNCRFLNSREADFVVGSEHGSSIRRCTSTGSRRFIQESGTIAPVTIQDCHVTGWTDPQGAVYLNGSPVLMFDCTFDGPASSRPPVRLVNGAQRLLVSNNRVRTSDGGRPNHDVPDVPAPLDRLVQRTPACKVYVIPQGHAPRRRRAADARFFEDTAVVPGKIFDAVREFGAVGNGRSDDTAAIQAAIDAARQAGHGAIAYLPAGRYLVSRTLAVTGSDYTLGGSGLRSGLVRRGPAGQPMVAVSGVRNVTLANLSIGHSDLGPMNHGADVRITSPAGTPCRLILDEVYAYGMYQKAPDVHGIEFVDLPAGSVVNVPHVQGNLRIVGSHRAKFLFRTSYEGTLTIEGSASKNDGLIGFLTRLATVCKPALRVRDNRSLVMSEFYNEQTLVLAVLEGKPGQPEGRVTIQGPKMNTFTQEPVFDLRGYAGQVYYGQSQFYNEPKEPRFVSSQATKAWLILAGNFWYRTTPRFELSPQVKLTLLANREVPDAGVDDEALEAMAVSLDDLRRLGDLDCEFSAMRE